MELNEIIKPENLVYTKPKLLNDNPMHYCPGCSHGVIHKLIAEVVADMGMEDKTIGISPVGCAVFAYNYIDVDWVEAAHGRAPAIATAIKRLNPSKMVFTYQGDGDLAAIGTAETIHAANRGENIVIIFVNNAIYGMTGGQMAPTTLVGMKTSTCPYGRDVALNGYPLKIGNLLAQLDGTCVIFIRVISGGTTILTRRNSSTSVQKSIWNRRIHNFQPELKAYKTMFISEKTACLLKKAAIFKCSRHASNKISSEDISDGKTKLLIS